MKKLIFLLTLLIMMLSVMTAFAADSRDSESDRRGGYCWSQGDRQGEYDCRDGCCRRR